MTFERGKPKGKLEKIGRAPNRRGTKVRFKPDPQIFGKSAHFRPERVFKMSRSKAYLLWRRRNPLVLRAGVAQGRRGRSGEGELSFRRRSQGLPQRATRRRNAGASRHLRRQFGQDRQARRAPNGRSPGPPMSTAFSPPTATPSRRRTAARTNPACAARCSRGLKDHAERIGQGKRAAAITSRRRDGRRRLHAVGVHPRAGIPGPDQGPPRHRGSAPASSNRRSRTRSTTGSPAIRCRPTSCSTS